MLGIIRDIFRGSFKSIERMYTKNPGRSFDEMEAVLRQMKKAIPEEYHTYLEQYEASMMQLLDAACEDEFITGYRLGVRMLLAAWPENA